MKTKGCGETGHQKGNKKATRLNFYFENGSFILLSYFLAYFSNRVLDRLSVRRDNPYWYLRQAQFVYTVQKCSSVFLSLS